MATPLALLGVTPRMLTWRGHQIALHEQGTGPVVLLVHSMRLTIVWWRSICWGLVILIAHR
jgi:hypothetical protein